MKSMSKYQKLWQWINQNGSESIQLRFSDIEDILGFQIDHSFLTFKKELSDYGYQVVKISMKDKTVSFAVSKSN